ncbi:hypothetical protein D3C78_1929290 [compost metagenome]
MLQGKFLKKRMRFVGAEEHGNQSVNVLPELLGIPAYCIALDNLQLPHSADSRAYSLPCHVYFLPNFLMAQPGIFYYIV